MQCEALITLELSGALKRIKWNKNRGDRKRKLSFICMWLLKQRNIGSFGSPFCLMLFTFFSSPSELSAKVTIPTESGCNNASGVKQTSVAS